MRPVIKTLLKASAVLVCIILVAVSGIWVCLKSQMPNLDGTITAPYLKTAVEIKRDRWGIPHINAEDSDDAHFALGYVMAQDRLFQMDLMRRLSQGQLAEILGPDLLDVDKMYRTFMFHHHARDYLARSEKINPRALTRIDSYLAGINHFIDKGPLPVEYAILGIKPRTFTRMDTVSSTIYMAYSLCDGIKRDSLYSMLAEKLSKEDLSLIFPDYTAVNRVTIKEGVIATDEKITDTPMANGTDGSASGFFVSLLKTLSKAEKWVPAYSGSNSWVVAPSRSATGAALLANDPHINVSKPDTWYEAHVSFPEFNVYGHFVPMIPFAMIAHDDHKGWGVTMFENDEFDFYGETFHPDDENQVMYKGKWQDVEIIRDLIHVKDQEDVELVIRKTSHGPVISDFIKGYKGKPLSFSWVFYQLENPILDILNGMTEARNLDQFRQAVSKLVSPGLNISYADRRGNIAWWAAGRVPVRPESVDAKAVLDGASGTDEIRGYVPFEDNPSLVNPESGIIITANNLPTIAPVGKIKRLKGYFRPSDRAARITELLGQQEKWSTEDMMRVQTDNHLWAGGTMKAVMVDMLKNFEGGFSPVHKRAYDILKNWEGAMDTETKGGTIFQFTLYHILQVGLGEALGSEHLKTYGNIPDYWNFLRILLKKNASFSTTLFKNRDRVVIRAFENACAELKSKFGSNVSQWQWGRAHTLELVHPLGQVKPLNLFFNTGPYPAPAENNVVNKFQSDFGTHDFKVTSIPSTRRLINLADPEASYVILPSGNSGNVMSPHYDDQIEMFLAGRYRKINFTDEQINKELKNVLILKPE